VDGDDELLIGSVAALAEGRWESIAEARDYPLHVVAAHGIRRKIVYATKADWLFWLTDARRSIPTDVGILWRHGPLGPDELGCVGGVVRQFNAPAAFVGDLDPLDLVTYASLTLPQGPVAISYLGVSDTWLRSCVRDLASAAGPPFSSLCIPMTPVERSSLERLWQLPIDWASILGPECIALLKSGVKLELEGASNPDLYSRAFVEHLLALLFQRGGGGAAQQGDEADKA
jgi:hypothetical protein